MSRLEQSLIEKMKLLKEEDDLFNAAKALNSMIFFLSTAKSMAESPHSKYEDFIRWFENNPEYKFFAEVESLKDILNEYKNGTKS